MNLVHELSRQAPEQIAIIDRRNAVTFGELWQRVQGGAQLLKESGLRKGDPVLVLHPISIELYEILLSAFHAGLTVILIDPAKGNTFLKHCIKWLPPKAFLGSPKAQLLRLRHRSLHNCFHTGKWLPFTQPWRPKASPCEITQMDPDDPALITFTSGSTGLPKGIERSHGFLLAQDRTLHRSLRLRPGQVDLITLPVFLLSNLAHGVTSVIADTDLTQPGFPEVQKILTQVTQHRVTRCTASPAFLEKMPDAFFDPLTQVYTGGAPVFPDLLARFPEKFHAVYGSSEAEPIAHLAASDLDSSAVATGGGLPAGRVIDEIEIRLLDDEILVTGEHVLKSYLDGRGDTETKVTLDGKIWHRTGDAGRFDKDGNLWLLGRHHAKWNGLYPLQIEAAARAQHPGAQCAFWKGVLYLEEELKIHLPWAQLHDIKIIEKIPMDSRHNAKVDYTALTN